MWRSSGVIAIGIIFLLTMRIWPAVGHNGCAVKFASQSVRLVEPNDYPLPVLWAKSPCLDSLGGWLGGRVALASGNAVLAGQYLTAAQAQTPTNPLLLADTLVALSQAEQYHETITLFAQTAGNSASQLPRVREAVAWAFLSLGDWKQAHGLLPEHLLPLYYLWQSEGSLVDYATMQNVTVSRVDAHDSRLTMATAEILPELVSQGIWSADLAAQVHDFVAWQHGLARPLPLSLAKPPTDWTAYGLTEDDFGENMLPHSQFAGVQGGRPQGWQFGNYVAPPDDGRFIGGLDGSTVRLMGLGEVRPIAGFMALVGQPSEGTGSYFLLLESEQPYYISGWYATATVGELASIYVGTQSAVALDESLHATDGQWRWISFSICGLPSEAGRAQVVFRLQSTGSLWLDNWSVQPVLNPTQPCIRL